MMDRVRSVVALWPLAVLVLFFILFVVGMGAFAADPCGVYHLREVDEIACRAAP